VLQPKDSFVIGKKVTNCLGRRGGQPASEGISQQHQLILRRRYIAAGTSRKKKIGQDKRIENIVGVANWPQRLSGEKIVKEKKKENSARGKTGFLGRPALPKEPASKMSEAQPCNISGSEGYYRVTNLKKSSKSADDSISPEMMVDIARKSHTVYKLERRPEGWGMSHR